MERVIVTVRRESDAWERDLDIPADIPVEVLVREICLAMGWSDVYEVYADSQKRVLQPGETPVQAGIWDGDVLTFQSPGKRSRRASSSLPLSRPPHHPPSGSGPVKGWRPLGTPGQSAPSQDEPTPPSPSGGFVWKRVDDD